MSSDPTTLRVALRYALATARTVTASGDYFKVGDPVLFGRWKNHHGRILSFGSDKHGNPTVEIEPVPKGRKQIKILGLFRIWHDPPPDQRGSGAHVASDPDDSNDEHDFDD